MGILPCKKRWVSFLVKNNNGSGSRLLGWGARIAFHRAWIAVPVELYEKTERLIYIDLPIVSAFLKMPKMPKTIELKIPQIFFKNGIASVEAEERGVQMGRRLQQRWDYRAKQQVFQHIR